MIFWIVLAVLAAAYLLVNLLGKSRVQVRHYKIINEKITAPAKLALVTDLHSSPYGKDMEQLMNLLDGEAPDAILLGGDIFNASGSDENGYRFLDAVTKKYPCYYVLGNHERTSRHASAISAALRAYPLTVLSGDCVPFRVNGGTIQICGVDDLADFHPFYIWQLNKASSQRNDALFSLLLVHRPDEYPLFLRYGYDLVLCGHAHGGQWRIPGLVNGVYAPGQGLFPQYAGGRYDFQEQTMIVSRGLSKKPYWAPRIMNPPELVILELSPAE